MKFKNLIEQIANDFIQHWNEKDMDKLSNFLSNDVVIKSPKIIQLFPEEKNGILRSKEKVMTYWRKLNQEQFVTMKLIILHKSSKVIKCEVDIGSANEKLFATLSIDEYGKFIEMEMEYR